MDESFEEGESDENSLGFMVAKSKRRHASGDSVKRYASKPRKQLLVDRQNSSPDHSHWDDRCRHQSGDSNRSSLTPTISRGSRSSTESRDSDLTTLPSPDSRNACQVELSSQIVCSFSAGRNGRINDSLETFDTSGCRLLKTEFQEKSYHYDPPGSQIAKQLDHNFLADWTEDWKCDYEKIDYTLRYNHLICLQRNREVLKKLLSKDETLVLLKPKVITFLTTLSTYDKKFRSSPISSPNLPKAKSILYAQQISIDGYRIIFLDLKQKSVVGDRKKQSVGEKFERLVTLASTDFSAHVDIVCNRLERGGSAFRILIPKEKDAFNILPTDGPSLAREGIEIKTSTSFEDYKKLKYCVQCKFGSIPYILFGKVTYASSSSRIAEKKDVIESVKCTSVNYMRIDDLLKRSTKLNSKYKKALSFVFNYFVDLESELEKPKNAGKVICQEFAEGESEKCSTKALDAKSRNDMDTKFEQFLLSVISEICYAGSPV